VNYPTLTYGTARVSQFIGNSLWNFRIPLVLHGLQGQESGFPRPITSLATCTYQLGSRLRQGWSRCVNCTKICSFLHPPRRCSTLCACIRLAGWNRQLVSRSETLRERIHPHVTASQSLCERLRSAGQLKLQLKGINSTIFINIDR
jgi:hypothetical protein